jgi:hypothetical protein
VRRKKLVKLENLFLLLYGRRLATTNQQGEGFGHQYSRCYMFV